MSAARYTGISLTMGGKYQVYNRYQGKSCYIGSYTTPGEAASVYDEACIFVVSLWNQEISTAVQVTVHCNTYSAFVNVAGHLLSHLLLLLPQHLQGANHPVWMQKKDPVNFPRSQYDRPPYFRMLIWRPLSDRSKFQGTPLPGMLANFAVKKLYLAPPLSVSDPSVSSTLTTVRSGVVSGHHRVVLLTTSCKPLTPCCHVILDACWMAHAI